MVPNDQPAGAYQAILSMLKTINGVTDDDTTPADDAADDTDINSDSSTSSNNQLSSGAIAGIIIACNIVVLAVLGCIGYWWLQKKTSKSGANALLLA
jgi:hypothetical protein